MKYIFLLEELSPSKKLNFLKGYSSLLGDCSGYPSSIIPLSLSTGLDDNKTFINIAKAIPEVFYNLDFVGMSGEDQNAISCGSDAHGCGWRGTWTPGRYISVNAEKIEFCTGTGKPSRLFNSHFQDFFQTE